MPRQPKLRKKKVGKSVYWFTKAGGDTSFGNVEDVSRGAWQVVRDAGYANAFTTLSGSLDARMNPYLLPRYGLAQRETNAVSLIALLRAGNSRVLEWQKTVAA